MDKLEDLLHSEEPLFVLVLEVGVVHELEELDQLEGKQLVSLLQQLEVVRFLLPSSKARTD